MQYYARRSNKTYTKECKLFTTEINYLSCTEPMMTITITTTKTTTGQTISTITITATTTTINNTENLAKLSNI